MRQGFGFRVQLEMSHLEADLSEGRVRAALNDGEQALLIWATVRFDAPAQRHSHFRRSDTDPSVDRLRAAEFAIILSNDGGKAGRFRI